MWLSDDMSLNLPGDSILQCGTCAMWQHHAFLQWGMWLWHHDTEFARWQHPAMWHMALWSRHWIRQVAAPCSVTRGSGIVTLNSPKRMPYWNSASGFDFDHITVVNMSFCTSLRNFIQIGLPTAEKMTLCRFSSWHISAILDFRGPIMGSLKSQCTTSYRWSIETIALKCLVFKKITFLHFGDRQVNRQTNRWTGLSH